MASLSHAVEMAQAMEWHVKQHARLCKDHKLTKHEKKSARVAKAKTMSILDSTIANVNRALEKAKQASRRSSPVKSAATTTTKATRTSRDSAPGDQQKADDLKKLMVSDGLSTQATTLRQMVAQATPVIGVFNKLQQESLSGYNAMINTVPVVGLLGTRIMFTETKLSSIPGQTVDQWSFFCDLPADAQPGPGKAVHFFPFSGDFYVSVGQDIWCRRHRQPGDVQLQQAVDNWPKLYVDEWSAKLPNFSLPAPDLVDVVPFVELQAGTGTATAYIMALDSQGNISAWTGDDPTTGGPFAAMTYRGSSPSVAPTWTQMTYSSGKICAYDGQNTWEMTPSIGDKFYTIANPVAVPVPITQLTANEVGPIGIQADGALYKRSLANSQPSGDHAPVFTWNKWIDGNGIQNLGVASAGVTVDLKLLVTILQARYISTQLALYPSVRMVYAFGTTHGAYLDNVLAQAQIFANSTDAQQQAAAQTAGTAAIKHASLWSKLLLNTANQNNDSVGQMSKQLDEVNDQLVIQLTNLRTTLRGLQIQLKTDQDALDSARAALWGSLAAMLIGLAVVIAGFVTANPYLVGVGGLIFAGGAIATGIEGASAADCAVKLAKTQASITTVTNSITDLSGIVNNFGNLKDSYDAINEFWGRLSVDAFTISTDDEVTLAMGVAILEDPSSIQTAKSVSLDMADGALAYLDMLNSQHIVIPDGDLPSTALLRRHTASKAHLGAQKLEHGVMLARESLEAGNVEEYFARLNHAVVLKTAQDLESLRDVTATGLWLDVSKLRQTGSVFGPLASSELATFSQKSLLALTDTPIPLPDPSAPLPVQSQQLNKALTVLGPRIVNMLNLTLQLAESAQIWKTKFPQLPTPQEQSDADTLKNDATNKCHLAFESARDTYNAFGSFNGAAVTFHNTAVAQASDQLKSNDATLAGIDEQISEYPHSPPWYVYLAGGIGAAGWFADQALQKSHAQDNRNATASTLSAALAALESLADSGPSQDGAAGNWSDAVQSVSKNLGSIADTLFAEKFQLWEDPEGYARLMQTEWATVIANANAVLQILEHATAQPQTLSKHTRLTAVVGDESVVESLEAPAGLSSAISSQSSDIQDGLKAIASLRQLPSKNDIAAYQDEDKQTSLAALIMNVRSQYATVLNSARDAMLAIESAAQVEILRSDAAAQQGISVVDFVRQSFQTAQFTVQAANQTLSVFNSILPEVTRAVGGSGSSMDIAMLCLDELKKLSSSGGQDAMAEVIAKVVAFVFNGTGLAGKIGLTGPLLAAIALAAQTNETVQAAFDTYIAILEDMSPDDVQQVATALEKLRPLVQSPQMSLDALEKSVSRVVTGMNEIVTLLSILADGLHSQYNAIENGQWPGGIDAQQAGAIRDSWVQVANACHAWVDAYSKV
ncbi:hypothetical protein LTR62_004757 [Meristemomyces frigidus]|uniref:Uncharacterized protein n=1 Tax=Meristemomyces frigidus TaxID=1508187 RepID=A0AAN7YFV4_9PEZI|nr:hypothetical protein LTR62_004757 [Meristemomyces frigidus]